MEKKELPQAREERVTPYTLLRKYGEGKITHAREELQEGRIPTSLEGIDNLRAAMLWG